MSEIWKDIAGYEGYYQISDTGRVKSLKRAKRRVEDRILVQWDNKNGYFICTLNKPLTKKTTPKVHRLVAQAFIPNPADKPQVNHIDGNTKNNSVSNLEWVTNSENQKHAVKRIGRCYVGNNSPARKLTETQVLEIRSIKRVKKQPSYKEIGKRYGVSYGAIAAIRQGNNWKHLNK